MDNILMTLTIAHISLSLFILKILVDQIKDTSSLKSKMDSIEKQNEKQEHRLERQEDVFVKAFEEKFEKIFNILKNSKNFDIIMDKEKNNF